MPLKHVVLENTCVLCEKPDSPHCEPDRDVFSRHASGWVFYRIEDSDVYNHPAVIDVIIEKLISKTVIAGHIRFNLLTDENLKYIVQSINSKAVLADIGRTCPGVFTIDTDTALKCLRAMISVKSHFPETISLSDELINRLSSQEAYRLLQLVFDKKTWNYLINMNYKTALMRAVPLVLTDPACVEFLFTLSQTIELRESEGTIVDMLDRIRKTGLKEQEFMALVMDVAKSNPSYSESEINTFIFVAVKAYCTDMAYLTADARSLEERYGIIKPLLKQLIKSIKRTWHNR
ncbi:MAG: hypothetical protein QW561_03985 [Candidatus Aenigmatarchaeota archaeon]